MLSNEDEVLEITQQKVNVLRLRQNVRLTQKNFSQSAFSWADNIPWGGLGFLGDGEFYRV